MTPPSTLFQSYHGERSHYSCPPLVLLALALGSEVLKYRAHPIDNLTKNLEDPGRLKLGTIGSRVLHFTAEPPRTPTVCTELLIKSLDHTTKFSTQPN